MKKSFKKFGVIVLALAMVFALTIPAMAADGDTPVVADGEATTTTHTDVYSGSGKTEATITGTTIPLTKGIVLFNTDGSQIREPNISFTYTVTPIDETAANQGKPLSGVTVTDDGSKNGGTAVTVTVNDGVAAAFTTPLTLTFADTNAKAAAAQTGTELEKTGDLAVTVSAFPHAGVYRFKITEVANPTDVTTVGLDARDTTAYDSTRYLDVYIKNGTSGLEMYGAVIFKTTASTPGKDLIDPNTKKTTGFEPGTTDYESDKTVDKYHTFNLEVNKTTTGAAADLTHDFPFEITLTGNKSKTIVADYSKSGATYVGTEPTIVNINSTAVKLTPALSNGDSVKITGIPAGTTVLVKETNDTYDSYTPSLTTQTGFTGLELTETGALTALTGTTQLKNAATISDTTKNSVIGLTNNLAEISVTGITLRVAPFAAMAGAGFIFLAVSKKSKKEEEEA